MVGITLGIGIQEILEEGGEEEFGCVNDQAGEKTSPSEAGVIAPLVLGGGGLSNLAFTSHRETKSPELTIKEKRRGKKRNKFGDHLHQKKKKTPSVSVSELFPLPPRGREKRRRRKSKQ